MARYGHNCLQKASFYTTPVICFFIAASVNTLKIKIQSIVQKEKDTKYETNS